MERTLISWNVPNLITVPLMAFLGFLLASVVWQTYLKFATSQNSSANNAGGY